MGFSAELQIQEEEWVMQLVDKEVFGSLSKPNRCLVYRRYFGTTSSMAAELPRASLSAGLCMKPDTLTLSPHGILPEQRAHLIGNYVSAVRGDALLQRVVG